MRCTSRLVALFCSLAVSCPCPADTIHVPADYPTVQEAINAAAASGDEIIVAPGTYHELIDFDGKAILLRSSDGPEVTILDGAGLNDSVVKCVSGEGSETILRGFTITNGTAVSGGGIRITGSGPVVMDCWFVGNHTTSGSGGGLDSETGSNTLVLDCVFRSNSASNDGGGLHTQSSIITVINTLFADNRADGHSGSHSGAIAAGSSTVVVLNCTLHGNAANSRVGGIGNAASAVTLANCILWNNPPAELYGQDGGNTTVAYSDIAGGFPGTGNIDMDPMFLDAANGDLRLQTGSPCADAGDNGGVPGGTTTDLDGKPRFADDYCAADTGNGEAPMVDMGAYETPTCWVDLTHDCTVNTLDVLVFLGLWVQCDPLGDWNGDGVCNTLDVLLFLNGWVAGC